MARKKSNMKIVTVCAKCGKLPPVDNEHSNENWVAYKLNEPCECGGNWTSKIVTESN